MDELFAVVVKELAYKFVSVIYDTLCLFGVRDIVIHALLKVGKVGLNFNVMHVGLKAALHKPSCTRWERHDGKAV